MYGTPIVHPNHGCGGCSGCDCSGANCSGDGEGAAVVLVILLVLAAIGIVFSAIFLAVMGARLRFKS
jgi:hypothetical protein